ncbi:ribosomal protein S18-alanine N-acetyltransferase [bacterium]|nr:ribosomal protein S18-alanine N-acetyltransferase [bacterium]
MIKIVPPSDYPYLYAIDTANTPHHFGEEKLKSDFKEKEALIAGFYRQDTPVAFVDYRFYADEVHIIHIAVGPEHHRQGIGLTLLNYLKQQYPGCPIFLELRASNLKALWLYQRAGFKQDGVRKKYYSDGEDALLMSLRP